jgi:outer membrane lipoprotein LolB
MITVMPTPVQGHRNPRLCPRSFRWFLALLLMALASCATVPQSERGDLGARAVFLEREERLVEVVEWRFAGRLVLDLPAESWTGQLSWRSQAQGQVIDLSGTMGRGGGRLLLGRDSAVLITRDGERYEAEDPDTLLVQVAGRDLPVRGLQYWVRGLPRPGVGFDPRTDAQGRPTGLIQDGWEIGYGPLEDADGIAMPMSVELKRGDLFLRLSIQRWQLVFPGGPT